MFQVLSSYSHSGELSQDFGISYNLHDSASICQTFRADFVSAHELILELGLTGRFVAAYLTFKFPLFSAICFSRK